MKHYRLQTCKCGRQTKRLFYTEVGKRCGECINREGLKRTGVPEYKSRARRLSDALAPIYSAIEAHEEAPDDLSEIESLKDEMETWRDGLQGTNLEYSPKYEEVDAACAELENGLSSLESAISSYNEALTPAPGTEDIKDNADHEDEIEDAKSEVESALSELENVSFPGMYS